MTDAPAPAPRTLKIDFVSDVVCPWCVVGLGGLETALEALKGQVTADITFQPFELNPQMAPEGENVGEHVAKKYGSTPAQSAQNRAMIRDRAAEVGFEMRMSEESRIWNTFDAHRLLHWALVENGKDKQGDMKRALFDVHFTQGRNLSDAAVLADAAQKAGLDRDAALDVLLSGRYAQEVRTDEELWRSRGINSVPAVVIEGKYLISGGQPAQVFENALRQIAAET
jgi:predicted DsbA family dithiol-disulfide isomerase